MNKRILNIVLIICLAIIWSFVFKKLFFSKLKEENVGYNSGIVQPEKTFSKIAKDTFDLLEIERNPFEKSKRVYKKTSVSNKSSNRKPNKKAIIKSTKKAVVSSGWPKISYYGFVRGSKNENKLALIKVDNKLHRVRKKTTINDEIDIVLIQADSVVVKRLGEQKIIKRK